MAIILAALSVISVASSRRGLVEAMMCEDVVLLLPGKKRRAEGWLMVMRVAVELVVGLVRREVRCDLLQRSRISGI